MQLCFEIRVSFLPVLLETSLKLGQLADKVFSIQDLYLA
jgi:hypothetical protein